jgi:hypothetical protein
MKGRRGQRASGKGREGAPRHRGNGGRNGALERREPECITPWTGQYENDMTRHDKGTRVGCLTPSAIDFLPLTGWIMGELLTQRQTASQYNGVKKLENDGADYVESLGCLGSINPALPLKIGTSTQDHSTNPS